MPDWLRDGVWQSVGVVMTALAVLVSIGIAFWQRSRKSLAFDAAITEVLSRSEDLEGHIRVLAGEKRVSDLRVLVLSLINDGNIPITREDFERPLMVRFGPTSQVLSAEIMEVRPANLQPVIQLLGADSGGPDANTVRLDPLLLNPRDRFRLKCLTASADPSPSIDARLTGTKIKKLTTLKGGSLHRAIFVLLAALIIGVGLVIAPSRVAQAVLAVVAIFLIGIFGSALLSDWIIGRLERRVHF